MAIILIKAVEETEKVKDITCDKCGRSMIGELGNIIGIRFSVSGGYDSEIFPDNEESLMIDVCEHCTDKWLSGWSKAYRKYVRFEVMEYGRQMTNKKQKKPRGCRAPYGERCGCIYCQMIARDLRDASRKKSVEVVKQ